MTDKDFIRTNQDLKGRLLRVRKHLSFMEGWRKRHFDDVYDSLSDDEIRAALHVICDVFQWDYFYALERELEDALHANAVAYGEYCFVKYGFSVVC